MAVAYVQSASATTTFPTQASTIAMTLGAPVGSGNTVAGAFVWLDGLTITSILDDKSNSYTVVDTADDTGGAANKLTSFYCPNITNAPTVVTIIISAACFFLGGIIHEISGVDANPIDGHNTGVQTSASGTDSVTTSAITTSANGDYILGITIANNDFFTNEFTAGTGFTERRETGGAAIIDMQSEDKIQTSAGSIAATWTPANNSRFNSIIMAFKAAAAAGGAGPLIGGLRNKLAVGVG